MEISCLNIPRAYTELIQTLKVCGSAEETRGGPVFAFPHPIMLNITNPLERVLFDVERDANPFFHLMEAIWMFAGEQNVEWLLRFNKNFYKYAEPDGHMRGAYGFRWRFHFGLDQIFEIIQLLRSDPSTRRAVLTMWDPGYDLMKGFADYPCNTHIYFRVNQGELDMTVCNRSNDLIWGMLGSNAVHMTLLHELIAAAIEKPVGVYRVFTNNLHIYRTMPNFEEIWATPSTRDLYGGINGVKPYPLMTDNKFSKFFIDCRCFIYGHFEEIENEFLRNIAIPMYSRKLELIPANNDWRKAGEEWLERRTPPPEASAFLKSEDISPPVNESR